MQKPFLIVIIIALAGSIAINQFMPAFSASIAFFAGSLATLVLMYLLLPKQNINKVYAGPTMTLYVGNLPYKVHEGEVKELFSQYGFVDSVRLVRDRKTGRRKGFGFVEMSETGAKEALNKLNDHTFQERTLKVREAKNQDSEHIEKNKN